MPSGRRRRLRDNPRYVALRLLALRPRSVGDVQRRLSEKGFSGAVVSSVLTELQEKGLLDDARFAREIVRSSIARKPCGKRFLTAKLRLHHVPEAIIEEALAEVLPHAEERVLARRAAERQLPVLRKRSPDALTSRLLRFLLARGFSTDVSREVAGEVGKGGVLSDW